MHVFGKFSENSAFFESSGGVDKLWFGSPKGNLWLEQDVVSSLSTLALSLNFLDL